MRAFRAVLHDDVDTFGLLLTADMTAEQKMKAVDHATDHVEAFCFCGGAPMLMDDAFMRREGLVKSTIKRARRVV